MKREIKFRAWENYGEGHRYMIYDRGNLAEFFDATKGDNIMQFTGLLDRNNVEIYEGDILKTDVRAGNMKVIYFDTYASFMLEYKGLLYPLNEGADIELIGNIYENPELL